MCMIFSLQLNANNVRLEVLPRLFCKHERLGFNSTRDFLYYFVWKAAPVGVLDGLH